MSSYALLELLDFSINSQLIHELFRNCLSLIVVITLA